MACELDEQQLWSWIDRDAPELRAHVAVCAECREREAELRRAIGMAAAGGSPSPARLPERVGAYRVLRLIGQGAQGWVYEAEQQTTQRRVALKVFRGGAGPAGRDARLFEREAQSLARLRHPGIAAIYEAGVSDEGWAYIAMECIDGRPLNAFARQRDLSATERLRLVLRVCEAVAAAHQKGVIHRDLKPSNILVDDSGQPHVLDFGLARLEGSDLTLTCTQDAGGRVVGTLPYMSPEQAAGAAHDIDVRTDVYAIGVLLYELLTGRLPHDVSRSLPHEALRAIREDEPPRPGSIRRALRGDVETVILKALAKQPARRYAGVTALAEDLERLLSGEPIHARPPGALYQLRRLVARHRGVFAGACLLFAVVLAFGVLATIQAARERAARSFATQQAESATRSAARAERTRAFLEELLLAADPRWTAGEMNILDLLAEAERRIEQQSDPEIEADLRALLGRTYMHFGLATRSIVQLRAALDVRERLHPPHHPAIADACADLASAMFGDADRRPVVELYERAVAIRTAALGPTDQATLAAMSKLGTLLSHMGEHGRAIELLSRVREARGHDADAVRRASAMDDLAAALAAGGQLVEAEALSREALGARRAAFGEDHRQYAVGLAALGGVLLAGGDAPQAEQCFTEALRVFRALGDQMPNELLMMQRIAESRQRHGTLDAAAEQLDEALALAQRSLPRWHYITASIELQLGRCLAAAGNFEQAERHLLASLEGYARLNGDEHLTTRAVHAALAELYADWGRGELEAQHRARSTQAAVLAPRGAP